MAVAMSSRDIGADTPAQYRADHGTHLLVALFVAHRIADGAADDGAKDGRRGRSPRPMMTHRNPLDVTLLRGDLITHGLVERLNAHYIGSVVDLAGTRPAGKTGRKHHRPDFRCFVYSCSKHGSRSTFDYSLGGNVPGCY